MTKETQVIIYVIEIEDPSGQDHHIFLTDDKKQAFEVRNKAVSFFRDYKVHSWTM